MISVEKTHSIIVVHTYVSENAEIFSLIFSKRNIILFSMLLRLRKIVQTVQKTIFSPM